MSTTSWLNGWNSTIILRAIGTTCTYSQSSWLRKSKILPQHQGACWSGRGRFLATRKTPSKHLKRLSQRAGENTLYFQKWLLFCIFCSQKTWNSCSSLPECCGFQTKNITTEFESPWGSRRGFFFLFTNSTNKREYGLKYGSGRSFCSSLYAIIVCGILEKAAANASSY